VTSVWSGAGLVFGRGHEDHAIEAEVLPKTGRLFCVAAAGDTAFALAARGAAVTAVDANPAQLEYVRARIQKAPPRDGAVERTLSILRGLAPLAGWSRSAVRRFCDLEAVEEQVRFWRERLDTIRFRAVLAGLLSRPALRRAYAPDLLRPLPPRFDLAIRRRLARGFARHPNRTNPFARALLLGEAAQPAPAPVGLVLADVAEFLEQVEPRSFDGFSLSNVLDGASRDYAERLANAVRRAGVPGAPCVLRSFAEPRNAGEAEWAARDRSLLWGSVRTALPA
jgi:S-adenosylmethionine:diacylglycerol 3-amino-3-carboxypropyl transferase